MSAFGKKQASASAQYDEKLHESLPSEINDENAASVGSPSRFSRTPNPSPMPVKESSVAEQKTDSAPAEPEKAPAQAAASTPSSRPAPYRRPAMSPPGGAPAPEKSEEAKPSEPEKVPAQAAPVASTPRGSSGGGSYGRNVASSPRESGQSDGAQPSRPYSSNGGGGNANYSRVAPPEEGYIRQIQTQLRPPSEEFVKRMEELSEKYGDALNKVVIAKGLPARLERLIDEVADYLGYGQEERIEAHLKGMIDPEGFTQKLTQFREQKILPARKNSAASFKDALAQNPSSIVFNQVNPRGDSSFVVLDRNTEEGRENAILHGAVIETVAASRTPFPNPSDFFSFNQNVSLEDEFQSAPKPEKAPTPVDEAGENSEPPKPRRSSLGF